MVEFFLSPLALAQYAQERGLRPHELAADPEYAVHAWLAEAVGPEVVRPFMVAQHQPRMRVLGYSNEDAGQLQQRIQLNAAPSVAAVLEQGRILSKLMPARFCAGERFAFDIRMLPTRKGIGNIEKDAFLIACDKVGKDVAVNRDAVYVAFAAERLAPAAELEAAQVVQFGFKRALRRGAAAESGAGSQRLLRVPQVLIRGIVKLKDPTAFAELLRAGVGRGSGLGYGMLLLRRP